MNIEIEFPDDFVVTGLDRAFFAAGVKRYFDQQVIATYSLMQLAEDFCIPVDKAPRAVAKLNAIDYVAFAKLDAEVLEAVPQTVGDFYGISIRKIAPKIVEICDPKPASSKHSYLSRVPPLWFCILLGNCIGVSIAVAIIIFFSKTFPALSREVEAYRHSTTHELNHRSDLPEAILVPQERDSKAIGIPTPDVEDAQPVCQVTASTSCPDTGAKHDERVSH